MIDIKNIDNYDEIMKAANPTLTIIIIVSLLVNSLILVAQWYALSPTGSQHFLQYVMVLVIPVILIMLLIPVLVLALLLPYKRKRTLGILITCVIYVASGFLMVKLSKVYREQVFIELAQRSQLLVTAIERYTKEKVYRRITCKIWYQII